MATSTESNGEATRDDLLVNGVLALVLTVLVVVTWWDFAVPPLPGTTDLAVAVVVGLVGGVGLQLAERLEYLRPFQENAAVFAVVMVAALAVGFTLFPDGLPVAGEVGILVLLWAAFATRVGVYLNLTSGSDDG